MKSHPAKSKTSHDSTALKDALLEIGGEELPAAFIALGIRQLKALAEPALREAGLTFTAVEAYGTPRRLALLITGLSAHSKDQEKAVTGPPEQMAKDAQGSWTPAALGFARKQGVDAGDLTVQDGKLCVVHRIKGLPTRTLLAHLFPQWINKLEFPKSMVWEPSRFRYPRPIRWIVALYGSDVVNVTVAGVKSGKFTLGLGHQTSKKIVIAQPAKYVSLLKNQCVLVEPSARVEAIRKLAEQAVRRTHEHVILHEGLLDQVSNLVEHPVAVLGHFEPAYLDLPREVLITCLEHHQKFFPVAASSEAGAKLLPHFVGIRNGMSVHQDIVREGYERVLAARLADARFFYNQDRRVKLSEKVDALRGVTFQAKLGSLFDKKERVKSLLQSFFPQLPEAQRVADLCKADLVTDMVREFPELQGVMARLYAKADGEDTAIAKALEEHYWPITLTGKLPSSDIAAAAALADKIDTLAGDFAIGLIPSGSADPYGLRRAAVGILRILEDRKWMMPLEDLIMKAIAVQPESVRAASKSTFETLGKFMTQRFAALLQERGYKPDEVEAILAQGVGVVHETVARLEALHAIRKKPDFEPLAAAFKRAGNIVRQAQQKGVVSGTDGLTIRAELLTEQAEQALYETYQTVQGQASEQFNQQAYQKALESMVVLREPLDQFFNGVKVMVDDSSVRDNRLMLLAKIVQLFQRVGDFSKLQNA